MNEGKEEDQGIAYIRQQRELIERTMDKEWKAEIANRRTRRHCKPFYRLIDMLHYNMPTVLCSDIKNFLIQSIKIISQVASKNHSKFYCQ